MEGHSWVRTYRCLLSEIMNLRVCMCVFTGLNVCFPPCYVETGSMCVCGDRLLMCSRLPWCGTDWRVSHWAGPEGTVVRPQIWQTLTAAEKHSPEEKLTNCRSMLGRRGRSFCFVVVLVNAVEVDIQSPSELLQSQVQIQNPFIRFCSDPSHLPTGGELSDDFLTSLIKKWIHLHSSWSAWLQQGSRADLHHRVFLLCTVDCWLELEGKWTFLHECNVTERRQRTRTRTRVSAECWLWFEDLR